ncbi:MAG: hypothetical protein AAF958_14200 [Planctomycetota bacterium]
MLADGASFLADSFARYGSRSITIANRRSGATITIADIPATIGQSERDEENADGVLRRIRTRDFMVNVADLADADDVTQYPLRGWIITDSLDSKRYEVVALDEANWHYVDNNNLRIRIHSVAIDAIP